MGALEQVRLMVWHDVGDQPAPPLPLVMAVLAPPARRMPVVQPLPMVTAVRTALVVAVGPPVTSPPSVGRPPSSPEWARWLLHLGRVAA